MAIFGYTDLRAWLDHFISGISCARGVDFGSVHTNGIEDIGDPDYSCSVHAAGF